MDFLRWLKNLWTNFLVYSCTIYFASIFLKVMQGTHLEFSQKFPVKSQIFLHIYLIPIMYESWKLKKVKSNRILFPAILEQCELKMPWLRDSIFFDISMCKDKYKLECWPIRKLCFDILIQFYTQMTRTRDF